MDQNTGMGSFGIPYEYTVKQKTTAFLILKRIVLILCYVLWAGGNVAIVLMNRELLSAMLLFGSVSLWLLIHFTWRLTYVEYEYSFFGGTLTVCRILGGRSRRVLTEVSIRDLALAAPYDDDHVAQIGRFDVKRKIFAVSGMDAQEIYALIWKEKEGAKMLCIETTERAIKTMKYYNTSAFRS